MSSFRDFESSFHSLSKLASEFQANENFYLSPRYQESEARQDFIDKFWAALGWDVYHQKNINPYEREVRIEKSVIIDGRGKRADYAFFTAPNFAQARFLAEAKKPSKNLENNQDCFQAVRYGWNSNTPLAVLTDFEQFLILDSRYKPNVETSVSRILKKFHYTEFTDEEKFREIYFLFSRERVIKNSLEDFASTLERFRGARQAKLFQTAQIQPVDEAFLSELDKQREELARAFKTKNTNLEKDELTEITQRTLDRLVFIRFLEDKLVEPTEIIDNLGTKSGSAWRDFIAEMPRLNRTYNGIIFKPHDILDNPNFAPDESTFEIIRDWLAHKNSAYDFNTIPIHILGSIYERFLGKTIETTDDSAVVVDKPEVRKAGGVYYTPEYIVRYIVENTIGKLIEKKKPEEIAEMKFADIACGSGSFLLGIFDYLIAYHVEYHSENKTRRERAIKEGLCRETIDGNLQLTIQYKREILLNNIYGVDLDAQAVEVAQLSLYLKLLEEETTSTKQQFLSGFREQLLPPLHKNIVHGNSLIDYDIMDGMLFDTRELKQLNPMNFQAAFPEVFQKGGFHATVGNPPYIRIQTLMETSPQSAQYLKENYVSAEKGNYDIYVVFVEKALSLLNEHGKLGYILPHKFFNAKYGEALRGIIAKGKNLSHVVHFGDQQIFYGATTYTCLLHLNKEETEEFEFIKVDNLIAWRDEKQFIRGAINTTQLTQSEWNFTTGENTALFDKLQSIPTKLEHVTDRIFQGIKTSADKIYIVEEIERKENLVKIYSREKEKEYWLESELLHPLIKGGDSKRFQMLETKRLILFPYSSETAPVPRTLISSSKFKDTFPLTWQYLLENKTYLENRENGKMKGDKWYAFGRSQALDVMPLPKIFTPDIAPQSAFSLDPTGEFFFTGGVSGGYGILVKEDFSRNYILGLLNSRLLEWFIKQTATSMRGGWFSYEARFIKHLPIRTIDFANSQEKYIHDKIVELVEIILESKKSLAATHIDKDKQIFERLCKSLDQQIDNLVYDLYGLSSEERRIINEIH
jgi:type I restriction-modification system DNA methylase subunit